MGKVDEKPSRFHIITNTASKVSLLVLLFFSTLYILWVRSSIPLIFYMDNYREIVQISGYVLSAGYIFTLVTLIVRRFQESIFRLFSIGIFIFTTMLCCLGTNFAIHLPTILDSAILKDETYYLTGELEPFDIYAYHRLYKCTHTQIQCEMTPFRAGGGAEFRPLHLMIGTPDSRNEINVMYTFGDGTSNLIYTYGTPNRYYDDLVQFGNLLFYLAYYDHPEPNTRTYMIFQCALDNNDCVRLPFEYQGFGRYTEFKVDESKNEISLVFHSDLDSSEKKYIDETLIFTYGEHPTCHVEGCKILEELK